MNFRTLLCSTVMMLAVDAVAVAQTAHVGSDLPIIGDGYTAAKFVKDGNTAADVGRMRDARIDYQNAIAVCPFDEGATLGLARCAAAEGDLKSAIRYYQGAISAHHEEDTIDIQTEYISVLVQAGNGKEAVSLYNHVEELCRKGRVAIQMEIAPPVFRLDGSDYDPAKLQAMTHLIRAMNSGYSDDKRVSSEMQKALSLAPNAALIYFYLGQTYKAKAGYAVDALAAFGKASQLGGPEMRPFVGKALKEGPAEFMAAVKQAGLAAQ